MDKEGGLVNRPPLLVGWDPHVIVDKEGKSMLALKPEEDWSKEDDEFALANSKALNALYNVPTMSASMMTTPSSSLWYFIFKCIVDGTAPSAAIVGPMEVWLIVEALQGIRGRRSLIPLFDSVGMADGVMDRDMFAFVVFFLDYGIREADNVGPPVMNATNDLFPWSLSPLLSSASFSLAVMASALSFGGDSLFGECFHWWR
ncbi:gag-protease polyprotein [Trifolium pratense]|uniref:Gag-protease polyprotein n=1 Tax=Trifolium pratense TaxID=57577 RepID=A0A2K3NA11_TRIPR|nr:gag-protease polyprotein [Trifolium pratense]